MYLGLEVDASWKENDFFQKADSFSISWGGEQFDKVRFTFLVQTSWSCHVLRIGEMPLAQQDEPSSWRVVPRSAMNLCVRKKSPVHKVLPKRLQFKQVIEQLLL